MDFRARHLYEVTDGPELKKVNEHGEIKSGTIDAKELSADRLQCFAHEWRVVWHVGAGTVDSRGGWKNPGAAPAGLNRATQNREVKK